MLDCREDGRMHNRIQVCPCLRVRQHELSERPPVEGTVGLQDLASKAPDDGVEDGLARLLELVGDGVRIDPLGAPGLEEPGDGALAGGDVASYGDAQPPGRVRRRAEPPR
jgi:hypothetical protein